MSLGERCDEIVRLIDETLVSVAADSAAAAEVAAPTGAGDLSGRRPAPRETVIVRRSSGPRR